MSRSSRSLAIVYGVPGDRLWVREGFNATWCDHMPRKFSRITLDVLDVHVERVQDIHADATYEEK